MTHHDSSYSHQSRISVFSFLRFNFLIILLFLSFLITCLAFSERLTSVSDSDHDRSFYSAAREGDIASIQYKINTEYYGKEEKLKQDLNQLDSRSMAPLHYAAKYGKVEAVRLLVEYGANPLLLGDGQCNPLHFVVKYRPNVLLNDVSDRQSSAADRRQSVTWSADGVRSDGFIETLKFLISEGNMIERNSSKKHVGRTTVVRKFKDKFISQDDEFECSPLHYAVYRNNVEAAIILLDHGADIDDQDHEGQTPLHLAALTGSVEIFKLFLEKNADVLKTENDGTTVLQLAVSEGHQKLAQEILSSFESGALKTSAREVLNQRDNKNKTVLHYAVEACSAELMEFLLTNAKSRDLSNLVNEKTGKPDLAKGKKRSIAWSKTGVTALHLAAEKGLLDVVEVLVKFGAKVDVANNAGETPLFLASQSNNPETVKFLLEKYPNAKGEPDRTGRTPLLAAADNGHLEVADILLDAQSDIFKRNKNDENLIFLAASNGHDTFLTHVLGCFKENNENILVLVNQQNLHNYTALHIAVENGHKS